MGDLTKKQEYITKFQEKIDKAKVVVLTSCEGVNVEGMTTLRAAVRQSNSELSVVKNTLFRRALNACNVTELDRHMVGSTAVAFGYEDPVAPVKAMFDFADKVKKFSFKAGIMDGKILSVEQLESLSKLPGRKKLLGMVASCMQGPLRNIVSVMQGPIRKFAYALNAIREKKEQEAA